MTRASESFSLEACENVARIALTGIHARMALFDLRSVEITSRSVTITEQDGRIFRIIIAVEEQTPESEEVAP